MLNSIDKECTSKVGVQTRVQQVNAFEREILMLKGAGVLELTENQLRGVQAYHQLILGSTPCSSANLLKESRQLTLGMKIASLFGAVTMATGVFFLFYQFFMEIDVYLQVTILIATPVIFLCLSLSLMKKREIYYAKISASISLVSFALNLFLLIRIFNLPYSPNIIFILSSFAFLLAYACKTRLLLILALISISNFIVIKISASNGIYWGGFSERLELFFIPAILLFLFCEFVSQKRFYGFESTYRTIALIMAFTPMLLLSIWGQGSYIELSADMVEVIYQVVGIMFSILVIWIGVKRDWKGIINIGCVFLAILLYIRIFDWWWSWMPKYLFFFTLGLFSLLLIMVFKRIQASKTSKAES